MSTDAPIPLLRRVPRSSPGVAPDGSMVLVEGEAISDIRERLVRMETTQAHHGTVLDQLLQQARLTNGRVTALETERATRDALGSSDDRRVGRWVAPIVTPVLTALLLTALKLAGVI